MGSQSLSYHPAPRRPTLALPRGACDVHVHVFGPQSRFPFAPGRSFTPCEAPKEKLFALHALLGVDRCVVVQSNALGDLQLRPRLRCRCASSCRSSASMAKPTMPIAIMPDITIEVLMLA
jgi:hypothetical protein